MPNSTYVALCRDYVKALRKQMPPLDATEYGLTSQTWVWVLNKLSDSWNVLLVVSMIPLLALLLDIAFNNLGSNPIQALHIYTGTWALRLLCVTLLITPIQKVTRWRGLASYRRMFGLLSFFYAALHVFGYVAVDHSGEWDVILTDVAETTYLWYGLFCFVILSLLALTSLNAMQRAMGKNWKKLHRSIYPASIAAVLHYFMQLKGNLAEPLFYAVVVGLLLGFRVLVWWKDQRLSHLMIPKRRRMLED